MEETKYNGNFIKVNELKIDNHVWEKAYLPDAIVVFPITEENEVVMIIEKRPHEAKKERLKFITGHIDKGESPINTALREMQEEAGYKAQNLEEILVHKSTGTINSRFYYILAKDLSESKLPNPDGEDTIVAIKKIPLSRLKEMIYNQELEWTLATLGVFKIFKDLNI